MRIHPRVAIFLLVMATLAGCAAGPAPQPPPAPKEPAEPERDPFAVLEALSLGAQPDGKRLVADLERFVATAPRRFDNQHQHAAARDWIEAELQKAGLETRRQRFTGPSQTPGGASVEGQNILGILPGRDPSRYLMFGAHYDGAFNGYGAAYDDGSGTLITIELARAMATYTWNHTLVFALWDQEEAGLVGSRAYVADFKKSHTNLSVYVNFDMTGINWPAKFLGATDVPLKADFGGPRDAELATLWRSAVSFQKFPAAAATVGSGLMGAPSDHGAFLQGGYAASWVRGAVIGNYPYYHNVDTVETMIADVGGNRADLEAGFQTALRTTFLFAFLVDHGGVFPTE